MHYCIAYDVWGQRINSKNYVLISYALTPLQEGSGSLHEQLDGLPLNRDYLKYSTQRPQRMK